MRINIEMTMISFGYERNVQQIFYNRNVKRVLTHALIENNILTRTYTHVTVIKYVMLGSPGNVGG